MDWMRSRLIFGWRRVSLWIGLCVLGILGIARACSHNDVSRVHIELVDLPQDKKPASDRAAVVSQRLECPSGGATPLDTSAPHTGHHKVFLKWNASQPSKQAPSEAAGYCLYRIADKKKKKDLKKKPTCDDCERINRFPVKETSCVDDLVKDGETYFYVAVAIAENHKLSTTSNEISVEIPRSEHPLKRDPPPGSYPACRTPPAEKGIAAGH
jgi:hypothetical protein